MYEKPRQENRPGPLNRRRFMQIAAMTSGGALLAACDSSTPAQPVKLTAIPTMSSQSVGATVTAEVGKTYFPSGDPNVADAFTAPLPPFQSVFTVPGSGAAVNSFAITSDPPVTPKGSNKFWAELEKRLNVQWNATLVTSDVYPEKVGALLASGNLPDIFMVDTNYAPGILQAIQQGAFTDLTPHVTGSALNDYPNLAKISTLSWQNSMINGKHYTVPRPRPLTGYGLLYRKDWVTKLGIAEPKNADDFFNLLQAFTRKNPDGGSSATWGMGFATNSSFTASHALFFFNLYNVPNLWRKNADGSLTYYIETDEFKQAIAFIRRVYAAGLFYPNSLTQSGQDNKDNFSAGKFGAYMDTITGTPDQTKKLKSIHPDAVLSVMTPFGANGGPANHWMGPGFNAAAGIPSSTGSNENRLKEMLRILDYLAAPVFSVENNFLNYGIDGWDNTPGPNGTRVPTPTGTNEIPGLANQANGELVYYHPSITANPHLALDNQEFTRNLLKIAVHNPALGLYSPTAVKQSAVLTSLIDDRVLRIVKGTDPLSAISDLVSSWRAQGGTQIAKEYAAALAKA